MYYSIHHSTRFRYSKPVSESIMEVRMHPRSEGIQRCLTFDLRLSPRTQVSFYRDFHGNVVHHFDVPRSHSQLSINARAVVEMSAPIPVPRALDEAAWNEVDRMIAGGDYFFELEPSRFTQPSEHLRQLARELSIEQRRGDPLSLLRELSASIHDYFDYAPQSTRVDSLIDDALASRKGVCQDFAHIMIALVREFLQLPCRYVSGYLFHVVEYHDRSAADATHAWLEVMLPGLGWVGFDPTNDLIAGARHIRVAIGRDYRDVPPTRGIFKGTSESELSVAVEVTPCEAPPIHEEPDRFMTQPPADQLTAQQQQQQQQQ
ncbi:MAG: transglutaminase family protein [Pyrinomonadaceae bacterium]